MFVVLLCLEIALVKWLVLGRVKPGQYDLHSGFSVRKWFVDQLLELSLDVIGELYATIYLSPWYRLLGARLGRRAEVSTASFISPDLLRVDDEGFIADAVSLGAARVEDGRVTVAEVHVGRRAFVGNSALLPPGAIIGENGLIGCLSIPPISAPSARGAGTSWLGSPAIFLPQRQESHAFDEERTFSPSRKLRLERAVIEFFRVTLPSTFFIVLTSLMLSIAVALDQRGFSTLSLALVFPLIYVLFGIVAALIVVAFKWALVGRYRPAEHPLWCSFVWRTELVTTLYENLARLFLVDRFEGTPLLAWYLRLLGAKVGKRVLLNSSEFTEFDLVSIGDDVALNKDCTIQTHLFEDRVMKMSTIRIGAHCSVGSQAVVLYDTEMQEARGNWQPLAAHEGRGAPAVDPMGREPGAGLAALERSGGGHGRRGCPCGSTRRPAERLNGVCVASARQPEQISPDDHAAEKHDRGDPLRHGQACEQGRLIAPECFVQEARDGIGDHQERAITSPSRLRRG